MKIRFYGFSPCELDHFYYIKGGGYFYFIFCNTLVFSFLSPFFDLQSMQERKNGRAMYLYGLVLPIGAFQNRGYRHARGLG